MQETHPDDGPGQQLWTDGHLTDGAIRAYLDRELGARRRLRALLHLRRCSACGAALEEQRLLADRAGALLSPTMRPVDVGEGWLRFRALAATARPQRSTHGARWPVPAATLVAATLVLAAIVVTPDRNADVALATQARDACCWDLDGGGRGDDGIFTLSRDGEVVECVVVYDDIDQSGTLSASDIIRYVSSTHACGVSHTVSLPRKATELFPTSLAKTAGS